MRCVEDGGAFISTLLPHLFWIDSEAVVELVRFSSPMGLSPTSLENQCKESNEERKKEMRTQCSTIVLGTWTGHMLPQA